MRSNSPQDFWKHVQKTKTCWIWLSSKNRGNYGQFRIMGKTYIAHRFSYWMTKGPIPEGLQVLHICDNPPCVNPAHLRLGTNQENVDDKMAKKRHWTFMKKVCKNGHVLTNENVRNRKDGARACRTCERELCRKYYAKRFMSNPEETAKRNAKLRAKYQPKTQKGFCRRGHPLPEFNPITGRRNNCNPCQVLRYHKRKQVVHERDQAN